MKKQAITLGRIGILLPVLLPITSVILSIPYINSVVGLAFAVLLMISHYHFSKIYKNPAIFSKALTGTIIHIAGNLAGGILLTVGLVDTSLGMLESTFDIAKALIFENALTITGTAVMLVGFIIAYYFIFKALENLASKTGIKLFRTAGLLYFIGAIAMIIFFIGSLVILVAWIIHIIAYFTIQPEAETETTSETEVSS